MLAIAVALAGCAQQRIRDESQLLLRGGEFEKAVAGLELGLKDHPDSALLRAGLLQARNEALSRLVAEAATQRAAGQLDAAEATLKRAQRFDSGGKRVDALLFDLATERRQRKALAEAEALAAKKQPEIALRVIADALKDSPRQSDLLALQRRLEVDIRQSQLRASQQGLSETRPISLDFRDASLRTVLDVVTRNSGVNFILDKDIRPDVRVTVFLRSARVEDAIDLIVSTHQLAKKVVDGQTILIYPNTPEKQREHQEQVVRVFYLASSEAKNAAAFLRSMLRIREPYVDERTNMLAIREAPENIELAERLIALYDTNEPEVLLDVEVIEVRATRLTELGIQFPDSFSLTALPPGDAANLTLGNIRNLTRNDIAVGVGGLLVNLKRQVGDFTTLANPRIRARNKEKAKIMIGDKVPVITATSSGGSGGFVSDSVSYIDVGLKLDVEPTVYADDEVAIRIGLEVSSVAGQVSTKSGSLAYQIGTRNASTMLRLRDGETQLLAGLISNEDRSAANRVPGLGDLPIAGRLFSSQRDEGNRTELVLAITPRVLRNLRRPDANETELWVGTESSPRVRPVGGRLASRADAAPITGQRPVPAAPAASGVAPSPTPGQSPDAAAPAGPAVLKWRGPSEVKVGDVFVATLELSSPTPLRGAPLQLSFNKDKLALVDIDEGEFFRQGGAATSFTKSIDAATGTARAGVLRNQATGTPGQGSVLVLRLKALAAGPAEVAVTGLEPITLGESMARPALPQALQLQVK
ncbi:MAG TPA: cohesin domain-containing protein [Albitalea sp.]|uniref:cohesin domain-containing protein n=1 Tax=Piscinibacter sp. TaxID=1903157 RepID=UPI002ED2C826